MRILALGLTLATSSVTYAAVKVERDGDSSVYREESTIEHIGKASDKIRAYVLTGKVEAPKEKMTTTCDQLFEVFHETAVGDLKPGHIDVIGLVECFRTKPNGPAKGLTFTYTFEAKTEADIPMLETFLRTHEGKTIAETKLSYRRAFGLLADAIVEFYDEAVLDEPGGVYDSYEKERIFMNWRQAESWVLKTADIIEDQNGGKLLQWIKSESDESTATYYRDMVMPETKMIRGSATVTYILEDRTVVRAPLDFNMGTKDSHEIAAGKSI